MSEGDFIMRRTIALVLFLILALGLTTGVTACGGDEPAEESSTTAASAVAGPVVRVGSLLDAEGTLLGSMVIQMLEASGIKTEDKTKLGTPEVVRAALLGGEIDATIDYTGSGQYYHEGEEGDPKWKNAEEAYAAIKQLDKDVNDIDWLTPAPANNSEFIATTRALAEAESITTMEDFAKYVNGGGTVKLIAAQTFIDNPLGLKGYEEAYGFTLTNDQLIALSTGNTAEMLSALAKGTDDVNFSLAYGTDGQLNELDLVIITDTKDVPPVYEPAPVFRGEIIAAYPQIQTILKPVFLSLDQAKLQELNARIAFGGEDPRAVATSYLEANGFLE
jgi:osmoprotectant transport system substrate-binding protein